MDFEAELKKLLDGEWEPLPRYELVEVLAEGQALLDVLNKKQSELSLQVEEIYDLAKEADPRELRATLNAEKGRLQQLLGVALGLSDMLEHFYVYAGQSGSAELEHQGRLLWQNSRLLLESCGIVRLGTAGESLNPALHTVQSAIDSDIPKEHIVRVLQSGYGYFGRLLRKAVVVVSRGAAWTDTEEAEIKETEEHEDNEDTDIETEETEEREDNEDTDIETEETEEREDNEDTERPGIEIENVEKIEENIAKEHTKNE